MTLLKLIFLLALALTLAPSAVSSGSVSYQNKAYVLARGEVNKPGMIPFTERMTVRHALVLFEGLTANADVSRVMVLGKDQRHLTVDLATMNGTNEVELKAGDVIAVPGLGKQHFFAFGQVSKPGVFDFSEGMTLRQAAILFEGPTYKASLARTFIVRKDKVGGRQQVIPVDMRAVMQGKMEDVPILADDIIFIEEFGIASKP